MTNAIGSQFYKQNIVADPEEPGVAKASRENLHDTSHARTSVDADAKYKKGRELVSVFEDTICEYCEPYDVLGQKRFTGKEIYSAFIEALENQRQWHLTEMSIIVDIIELSKGITPVDLS